MVTRNDVLRYIVDEYFNGVASRVAEASGYSLHQVESWLSGTRQPHKATIEYLVHCVFTPQFKVIVEFGEFDGERPVRTQLKARMALT